MKKPTIVASCFFLATVSLTLYSSFADAEEFNPIPVDEPTAKLIKRIDKLKNRIWELEAIVKQAHPANAPFSNNTPKTPNVVPDVFYTNGELPGGEWLIPNEDVEFDVLDGIAMTKGNRFNKSTPNEILASYSIILLGPKRRKNENRDEKMIEIELVDAVNNPKKRALIESINRGRELGQFRGVARSVVAVFLVPPCRRSGCLFLVAFRSFA